MTNDYVLPVVVHRELLASGLVNLLQSLLGGRSQRVHCRKLNVLGQFPGVLYLVHEVELSRIAYVSLTQGPRIDLKLTVSDLTTREYSSLRRSDHDSARWVRQADAVDVEAGWGMYCSTSFRTSSKTAVNKQRQRAYNRMLPPCVAHDTSQ